MKAVIFDMDGVITNSEPVHDEVHEQLAKEMGIKEKVKWTKYKGKPALDIFKQIIEEYGVEGVTPEELVQKKTKLYLEKIDGIKLFDGVIDLIKRLKKKYPLALVTSSQEKIQKAFFEKFNLDKYFDLIHNVKGIKYGKPNPDPYIKAISDLGFMPEECLIIEDAKNGVASGKLSGAFVCAVTHTFPRNQLQEADIIIDDYSELTIEKIEDLG